MLSNIFSPVWLPVMSYIIFLRNQKIKKYFMHVSFIAFFPVLLGSSIPYQRIFYTTQIFTFHWQQAWFLHWYQLF